MQIDLKGLRALVTGSTAGIGEAIAARLAQNGAEVVVNGRTAERVTEAIASLQARAPGARFHAAPGDVATAKGVQAILAAAGDVDILVNKRFIKSDEVADVVAFVCSREASAITGAPIRVDGGVVLSIT